MAVIGQLILAGAGTLIGNFFQKKSAEIARKREQDKIDLEEANRTFREVSTQIEEVVFYGGVIVRELMLVQANNELSVTDLENLDGYWDSYTNALANWSKTNYLKRANVRKSFGIDAEQTYKSIYEEFQQFDATLFELYHTKLDRNRKVPKSKAAQLDHTKYNVDFNQFQSFYAEKKEVFYSKLNSFNLMMSDMILHSKVGTSKE